MQQKKNKNHPRKFVQEGIKFIKPKFIPYIAEPESCVRDLAMKVYPDVILEIFSRTSQNKAKGTELVDFIESNFNISITDADIRRIVSNARCKEDCLIGSDGEGYYLIKTKEELENTIRHLYSRIHKQLYAMENMIINWEKQYGDYKQCDFFLDQEKFNADREKVLQSNN